MRSSDAMIATTAGVLALAAAAYLVLVLALPDAHPDPASPELCRGYAQRLAEIEAGGEDPYRPDERPMLTFMLQQCAIKAVRR